MIIAFHKPYGVLSQFTLPENTPPDSGTRTLAEFGFPKNIYPIGRLDWDSEGLLFLTDEKEWNDRLLNPEKKHERTYHAQVEGTATEEAMIQLRQGVVVQDYLTKPCRAGLLADPGYPARIPPIRVRLSVPDSWIELRLIEGKNRQVRRMTASVGFPTLRLIRAAHGGFQLGSLAAGKWIELDEEQRKLLLIKSV